MMCRCYYLFVNELDKKKTYFFQMGESTEENIRKENGDIKKQDAVTQMHAAAVNGDKALLAKIIVCEWNVHLIKYKSPPLWICMSVHFSKRELSDTFTMRKVLSNAGVEEFF